jgi:hypothetical protein
LDPLNPLAFSKTTTPVPNADLDPLLTMPCTSSATGQCSSQKDTIIVLPNSYTRIGFNTPLEAGLYVWHWCVWIVRASSRRLQLPAAAAAAAASVTSCAAWCADSDRCPLMFLSLFSVHIRAPFLLLLLLLAVPAATVQNHSNNH